METINVTRSSMPSYEEYIEEIKDLWDSRWLTNMGVKHVLLQHELKKYLGVDNIDLTTNGHMAIELALVTLGLKGEVITTPFTFASTVHAIVRAGLKPVFCDINPNDFTIDAQKIESLITEKTCAIMPVHVYGNICNIEEIESIAKKNRLKVVYDAAHAFGIKYRGTGIGAFGDVSCFSFHATKVFHTIEGGAVCFKDEDFGRRFNEIKDFGIHSEEVVDYIGANAKMNEFSAAMGLCNLRHIEDEIEKRRQIDMRYRDNLKGIAGIELNVHQDGVNPNYAYFPILIQENIFGRSRNEVAEELFKYGFRARKYFYPLINDFSCYRVLGYNSDKTPVAQYVSSRVLTLPFYADLPIEKVDSICKIIKNMKM